MRASVITFPTLVQDFFLKRLIEQRGVSARTVESYRDTFELLFIFVERRIGKKASALSLNDLDAPLVLDFLDYLESERHNGPRTRNARLTAIRSFMRYVAVRDRVTGRGPAGHRHSLEALRSTGPRLPLARGDNRTPQRSRSEHLEWTARRGSVRDDV